MNEIFFKSFYTLFWEFRPIFFLLFFLSLCWQTCLISSAKELLEPKKEKKFLKGGNICCCCYCYHSYELEELDLRVSLILSSFPSIRIFSFFFRFLSFSFPITVVVTTIINIIIVISFLFQFLDSIHLQLQNTESRNNLTKNFRGLFNTIISSDCKFLKRVLRCIVLYSA